jgi:hypothetical protein
MIIPLKVLKIAFCQFKTFLSIFHLRFFHNICSSVRHRVLKFAPDIYFEIDNTTTKSHHGYVVKKKYSLEVYYTYILGSKVAYLRDRLFRDQLDRIYSKCFVKGYYFSATGPCSQKFVILKFNLLRVITKRFSNMWFEETDVRWWHNHKKLFSIDKKLKYVVLSRQVQSCIKKEHTKRDWWIKMQTYSRCLLYCLVCLANNLK